MRKVVALVGASSTGKTTAYELLKNRLPEYSFINESTRTVAKYGFPINEEGTSETQLAISSFHLQALLTPGDLILDRSYMDLLTYSTHMPDISEPAFGYILSTWRRVKKYYTHFIYFPIEFTSVDDGVRSVNEEWRIKVDNTFQALLTDVPHLEVTGSPKQRIEQILNFIENE